MLGRLDDMRLIFSIILLVLSFCLLASPSVADPITAAVAAGVVAGASAGIGGAALIGAVVIGVVTAGLQLASSLLAPKPKTPEIPSFQAQQRGLTILVRGTNEPQRVIYGERLVGGIIVYEATSQEVNQFYHIVLDLAGHRSYDIPMLMIGDVPVAAADIDGDNFVATGPTTNENQGRCVFVKKHLGLWNQAADADLVAEVDEWTEEQQGRDQTYLYLYFASRADGYWQGRPNIRALVKGRLVVDWRDTSISITSSSVADPTVITTDSSHGLSVEDRVFIWGHSSSTPEIRGEYEVLSVPTPTTFTIDMPITIGGTGGSLHQMRWTDNAALCAADYLVAGSVRRDGIWDPLGPGSDPDDELDISAVQAAANICDEEVSLSSSTPTFTFTADADSDTLTQATPAAGERHKPLHTGDGVEVSTDGSLPGGLSPSTRYFAIPITPGDVNPQLAIKGGMESRYARFQLATTLDNARRGVAIPLSSAGTGTHTLTRKSQPRYTCNHVFRLDERPIDIFTPMADAMGGAGVFTQGLDTLFAGAYSGPATVTITESELRAPIKIRRAPSKRELFNTVTVNFPDRDEFWKPNESQPQQSATAVTADGGEELVKNLDYPAIDDQARAQRLARLVLLRHRESISVDAPVNLSGLRHAILDTIAIDNDLLGWDGKEFEVAGWGLDEGFGIDLALRETTSDLYAWDPDTDEIVVDLSPNTGLPNAFATVPPTNLQLFSGTDQLDLRADGTVFSRLKLSWTAPTDVFVTDGGQIEYAYKKSADSTWRSGLFVGGDTTSAFILDVQDGVAYDVAVRSWTRIGVRSDPDDDPDTWTAIVTDHTVVGKSESPSDVADFTAQQNGEAVTFAWTQVSDADLAGYEIRYKSQGSWDLPGGWDTATPLTRITRGTLITNAGLPPGSWTVGIKAVDTSGNESSNETIFNIEVISTFDVFVAADEHPRWLDARLF